ncbi:F-box/LRR-repeat protein 4 [Planococcus citri]|uniref:F-box/LRR-repeat protein 4 n=1 Tax=Planococcus citri TaxID=170843 RepID=UPI0031F904F9
MTTECDNKLNYFHCTEDSELYSVIEQYAADVRSFSSQYGSEISISYTAYNICGKPSKFPAYGDFPQTFVMRTYGKWWDEAPSRRVPIMPQNNRNIRSQDYIDITFEHKVRPLSVNIYETYHPGSVVRIWASDGANKWSLLWEGKPQIREHSPNIFSPDINRISYHTNLLRIEFDHSHLDYYTEIDAVSMTGLRKNTKTSQPSSPSSTKLSINDDDDDDRTPALECKQIQSDHRIDETRPDSICATKNYNGNFSVLPDETILKIFSYLDLVSLSRCARINSHFNSLATDSLLYTSLNLKPYWHLVNANSLDILSSRCEYLQRLDLSWCGSFPTDVSPKIFCEFIENCGKSLTHIRLDCCQFVCNCCIEMISQICKNLTELTLQNCTSVNDRGFSYLSTLRTIERLDLYRTLIEAPSLKEILKASPHLKHINLGSCRRISCMDEIAQILGTHNKELISVDFWKTYSLTPTGIKYLSQCSLLEEIDIGWCLGVSIPGDCFLSLAMGCPRLRKLFMGTLRGINDRDLYPFIYNCPNLEQIDLLGNRGITSEVCINILKSCKRLRFLDVSFCDQVNDVEVQEWKELFPSVDIKRSFQSEPECTCAFANHY